MTALLSDTFVLDASVGAKWFFQEELEERALRLKEGFQNKEIKVIVPEIFFAELANACWKRVQRKLISIEDAVMHLDIMMKLPLKVYSIRELADVALENALRFGISVYDALYLSLAEVYVCPLITADKALFKACRRRFDFIEFLGNI